MTLADLANLAPVVIAIALAAVALDREQRAVERRLDRIRHARLAGILREQKP